MCSIGVEARVNRLKASSQGQFYGVPNAVIYMTKWTLQRWKRIKEFAYAMLDTVLSILDGLEEPAEFVDAMRNLPLCSDATRGDRLAMTTTAEKLASSVFLYRELSRKRIERNDLRM
jgi:hypothetical protein